MRKKIEYRVVIEFVPTDRLYEYHFVDIVGKYTDGSGFGACGRDLEWCFKKREPAKDAYMKLSRSRTGKRRVTLWMRKDDDEILIRVSGHKAKSYIETTKRNGFSVDLRA